MQNLQLALKHHQNGDLEKAHALYTEILNLDPQNIEALHLLGILEAQQKNPQSALSFLQRAIAIDQKIPYLHNSLGNVFKHLGEIQKARQHYEEALRLEPNSATMHNNLANILVNLNENTAALTHYQQALKLKPDYSDAHYNFAILYIKQGQDADAIAHLNRTIQLDPQQVNAHNQLALILLRQNKEDQAIKHYQTCLQIDPDNLTAAQNLGALLCKKGEFDTAITYLEKALKKEPNHLETLHNLGAIYLQQKKIDVALECYLQLLFIAPDFNIYYNIGAIYMDQNRYGDALNYLLEALKIQPSDPSTLINLGAIYLKLEDYPKAIEKYQTALQIQPDNAEIQYLLSALQLQDENQTTTPKSAPEQYIRHLFDQYAPHFDTHLTKFLHYQVPDLLYAAVTQQLEKNNEKTQNAQISTRPPTHPTPPNSTEQYRKKYGISDSSCSAYNGRVGGITNQPPPSTETSSSRKLSILDLGCGTGLCGEKFRPLARKLIGVDLSIEMLNIARSKELYDELSCLDITAALANYTNNIDLILAADTLVYIGDLDTLFKNARQALNTEGYFAFTCENTEHYSYILQKTARFAHSLQYISYLAKKYGFIILQHNVITMRTQKGQPINGTLYILKP